ncbi:hypothetical protein TYRP_013924 [Tyrophagus putrescentiae]|nr:hypothetical protein TYRP_013924 [Tyrophagus putrescentiae]
MACSPMAKYIIVAMTPTTRLISRRLISEVAQTSFASARRVSSEPLKATLMATSIGFWWCATLRSSARSSVDSSAEDAQSSFGEDHQLIEERQRLLIWNVNRGDDGDGLSQSEPLQALHHH